MLTTVDCAAPPTGRRRDGLLVLVRVRDWDRDRLVSVPLLLGHTVLCYQSIDKRRKMRIVDKLRKVLAARTGEAQLRARARAWARGSNNDISESMALKHFAIDLRASPSIHLMNSCGAGAKELVHAWAVLTFLKAYPLPITARVVPIIMGTGCGMI